jgi:exonuclease I
MGLSRKLCRFAGILRAHGSYLLLARLRNFGAQPRYDRPAQFAGIRTDDQLNEIGEPVMWYCQPANDYLPDPQSCLITGITPQRALQEGVAEHEFAALIEAELAQAGTVGVGYNTIRGRRDHALHVLAQSH